MEVILGVVETAFVKRECVNFVGIRQFSTWPGQWVVGRQWWEVRSTHGKPCKGLRAVGDHWQVFGREVMSRLPSRPITLVAVWRVIWRGIRKGAGEWVRSLLQWLLWEVNSRSPGGGNGETWIDLCSRFYIIGYRQTLSFLDGRMRS